MASVTVRELGRDTKRIVAEVRERNKPTLITNRGTPVAAIMPIEDDLLEEFLLSKYVEDLGVIEEAERELAAGETISAEDAAAELDED
jgi:prevent-host-death family protein